MKTMNNPIKFLLSVLTLVAVSFAMAAGVSQATGFDAEAIQYTLMGVGALGLVPAGALGVISTVSIEEFKSAFGAYYQPRGQNAARLRKLLMYDGGPFHDQFMMMPLEGDTLEYALMAHTRILQAFKPKWSPTGQLSGKPMRKTLRRVKVNVEEIPDLVVNMWLGWLATEGGKDPNINRATWPFVRWYVESYLVPQAKEDQYLAAYYGVWEDPGTDATPGPHEHALDGIAVEINRAIDDGLTTPINTGALETDPELFVDQVEDFFEQVLDRYRGQEGIIINMHDTFVQRFKEGMLEKYNVNYPQASDPNLVRLRLRNNVVIRGHHNFTQGPGGAPSEKLICQPNGDLFKGVRVGNKEDGGMRIEQVDYTLKLFNDWHIMYGALDPRVTFTNDRELTYGIA